MSLPPSLRDVCPCVSSSNRGVSSKLERWRECRIAHTLLVDVFALLLVTPSPFFHVSMGVVVVVVVCSTTLVFFAYIDIVIFIRHLALSSASLVRSSILLAFSQKLRPKTPLVFTTTATTSFPFSHCSVTIYHTHSISSSPVRVGTTSTYSLMRVDGGLILATSWNLECEYFLYTALVVPPAAFAWFLTSAAATGLTSASV